MVPDIASISFKLAQLTVKSEQPNFGPFSPHFAETTSSSTDLSTLVHSCAPFDTVTSRSERQDHFGSDFVVIWAAMSFASLRLRPFEEVCGCSHHQNSPRIAKKPTSPLATWEKQCLVGTGFDQFLVPSSKICSLRAKPHSHCTQPRKLFFEQKKGRGTRGLWSFGFVRAVVRGERGQKRGARGFLSLAALFSIVRFPIHNKRHNDKRHALWAVSSP